MKTLLWFQTGTCGGETQAVLCADAPSFEQLFGLHGLELLWHPGLSRQSTRNTRKLIENIVVGELRLDMLCIEGSIITAPYGTGMFDTWMERAKKDWVLELAAQAENVIAMGTCAAFGGVHAAPPNPSDCTGLQFNKSEPGGLLPADWRAKSGLPVINVAGCPAHPDAMTQTLAWLAQELPLNLDELNRPQMHFSQVVHQGCTRNEYHEYNIEESTLGGRGCLFFNLGCQGPLTHAICNSELWNGQSSKTRIGVPCFGCTSPSFPIDSDLFATEKIGEVPVRLPLGVERPRYMAYKNLARAAAPPRVRNKEMEP